MSGGNPNHRDFFSPLFLHTGSTKRSHTITTTSTASEPAPFDGERAASLRRNRCTVCRLHEARYTCPKCQIPYCSVQCYQKHSNNQDDDTGGGTTVPSCTESFYKDRVSQVLQLEVKEKKDGMLQILSRMHQLEQDDNKDPSPVDQSFGISVEDRLSQDELVQLLSVLEKCQDDDEKLERLLSSLPSRVQKSVKAILQHAGDEPSDLQEWILDPWHPWWRTELVRNDQSEDDESNSEDSATDSAEILQQNPAKRRTRTLDERILAVPSFDTMRPARKGLQSPPLQYNLIDILYSIVWMLRLYHGPENACDIIAGEAFDTLVRASAVLSASDASFCYSSLPEMLADCTRRSTAAYSSANNGGSGDCSSPWNVLAWDAALICRTHRQVARALLEAIDVVTAAVRAAKKEKQEGRAEMASQMRKIRKKMEFYLSWFLSNKESVLCLTQEIESWIDDWTDDPKELSSIQLLRQDKLNEHRKGADKTKTQTKPSRPFIEEIESTRL